MNHDKHNIYFKHVVHTINRDDIVRKIEISESTRKPLLVKVGFDPTSMNLHVGHSILFNKLSEFQRMGHLIIFIIGDFTTQVGDPTGRNKLRPILSGTKIRRNSNSFYKQAMAFLNKKQTIFKYNSEWFNYLKLKDILNIASNFSLQQLLERTDFMSRFKYHQTISMHEMLYPLLQGYDSFIIGADIEIGGTDQLFNLVAGRHVMKKFGYSPQGIMTLPIIEGLDAHFNNGHLIGKKMSKSFNNSISLFDDPFTKFRKIMSIHDELMWKYYKIFFSYSTNDILLIKSSDDHIKDEKIKLALKMLSSTIGFQIAMKAMKKFNQFFGRSDAIENKDIFTITIKNDSTLNLIDILFKYKYVRSRSEAKRLIRQKGLYLNNNIVKDLNVTLNSKQMNSIRIGKKIRANIQFSLSNLESNSR
jgi:tyrosyl-tRNA synthetase